MKYKAFISYSHSDSKVAKRLHRWLESYRIPKRLEGRTTSIGQVPARLHPIFRDREELPTSSDLGSQIQSSLMQSATLIVLCSPKSAQSRWVNEEILCFKRLGRADRIFCLIVEGEPNATDKPGRAEEECFPEAVRFKLKADGSLSDIPAEPIAADLRAFGDGQKDAFLKIAAGVAGVGFDELRQREIQRQMRRALAVTAVSLILMALMTGLAITAFLAKQEATRQSSIAREERDRAEENFRAARDAVDRFYTKVSEEDLLKAEGLQPLRRDLLEQALGYYQTFLEQRKEDPAFAIDTAVVQSNVADILSEVADPSEALVAAVTATDMLQRVSGKMSSTSDYKVRMANALGLEAYVLDRLGRTEEAIQKQIQVIQIHESFPNGHEETSPEVLCHLWATRGAFEAQVNRLDDAIKSYEKGLKEGEKKQASLLAPLGMAVEQNNRGLLISGVMPDSPAEQAKLQVGDILLSLADDKLKAVEDLAQAKNKLKGNVSIPVSVMRSGETLELQMTPVYVGDFVLANTKYNLGYLLLIRLGEPEKAKPWLEQAVDEYRRCMFLGGDSMSTIRRGLTTAASSLGICGLRLGNENLYEQGARLAAKTADDNARANPAVPEIRSFAGAELTNLSSFFLKQDRYEEARVACESAISHFRIALETGGNLDSDRLKLMQSLTNLALIRGSQDGAQAAIPIYESVLDIASNFKESDVPELLIAMARLRRNYASSLRTGERMEEAAEQYRLASAIYLRLFEVLKSTGNNKVVQLYQEESIHMLPWRIALYLRLEKQESEALISNEFEEACRSLESTENGKAVVVRLRTGAVGTWCTFADSYDRGSVNELECLERAKTQLRLAEQLAGEDADLQSHISSARGWLADSTADKK